MEYEIYKIDELTHHGVKGQKWGIRRYQRKDGSLTPAGQKRRAKLEAEIEKLGGKKGSSDAPRKKTVAEMTDDEVRAQANRMRIEKDYYDAAKALAAANPKKVSAGKRFLNSMLNDVVAPAAKDAGRKWLTNVMEDKLGLNKKTEMQKLEDQWKKLDYKKKISDLKKGIDENEDTSVAEMEKLWKKLDYEKKINDLKNPKDDDPYGLKDIEAKRNKAKAEYEYADYKDKRSNVGKSKDEKTDWESKNKEQNYHKNRYETEKAQRDWETYQREKETLGDEEAWKNYTAKQKK